MKNLKTKEYREILAYIHHEMSPEQRKAFQAEMLRNPAKIEEVEEVKRLIELTKDAYYEDKVTQMLKRSKVVPLWQRPSVWMVAASTILVLSIGGWWILDKRQDPKEIVKTDYQPELMEMARTLVREPIELTDVPEQFSRERESVDNDMEIGDAIGRLEKMKVKMGATVEGDSGKQQYGASQEAKPGKSEISVKDEGYRLLLLGIGYLKQEDAPQALRAFGKIQYEGLAQDQRWYTALAYLQTGEYVKARTALLKVTDARYAADAQALLERMPR